MAESKARYRLIFEGPAKNTPMVLQRLKGVFIADFELSIPEVQRILTEFPVVVYQGDQGDTARHLLRTLVNAGANAKLEEPQADPELSAFSDEGSDTADLDFELGTIAADEVQVITPDTRDPEPLEVLFEFDDSKSAADSRKSSASPPTPETKAADGDAPSFFELLEANTPPPAEQPSAADSQTVPELDLTNDSEFTDLETLSDNPTTAAPADWFDPNELGAALQAAVAASEETEVKADTSAAETTFALENKFSGPPKAAPPEDDFDLSIAPEPALPAHPPAEKKPWNLPLKDRGPKRAVSEQETNSAVAAAVGHPATGDKSDEQREPSLVWEIGLPVLVGGIVLFVGTWWIAHFLAEEPENYELRANLATIIKELPGTGAGAEGVPEPEETFELKGRNHSAEVEVHAVLRASAAQLLSGSLELKIPEPPELSPEQLILGQKRSPYISKVVVDNFEFIPAADGSFEGEGTAKVYIEGRRFLATAAANCRYSPATKTVNGKVILVMNYDALPPEQPGFKTWHRPDGSYAVAIVGLIEARATE